MTTLADFLPKVYEITDRPDLVTETTSALTRALRKAHYKSRFDFDLDVQIIPYTNDMPLTVAKPADYRATHSMDAEYFNIAEISPEAIFNPNAMMAKRNCYYRAGDNLVLRVYDSFTQISHQYFKIPDWATSYIAANYPEVIYDYAAARIFSFINAGDQAKYYEQLGAEGVNEIVNNHFAF